jgi:hypothetical protein
MFRWKAFQKYINQFIKNKYKKYLFKIFFPHILYFNTWISSLVHPFLGHTF